MNVLISEVIHFFTGALNCRSSQGMIRLSIFLLLAAAALQLPAQTPTLNWLLKDSGRYDAAGRRTGAWVEFAVDSSGLKKTTTAVMPNGEKKQMPGTIVIQRAAGNYAEGLRQGEWRVFKSYNISGPLNWELQESAFYSSGKLNGLWKYFMVTGQVLYQQDYVDGKRHGKFIEYYSGTSAPKRELDYERDLPLKERLFYETGVLMQEAAFVNGKTHGVYRYYYPNGKLWTEQDFRDGLLWNVIVNYGPDGKPQDKGTIKDGNGTLNRYDENGKLTHVYDVTDGVSKARQ